MSEKPAEWEGGKCRRPMWMYPGIPAGFCGEPAFGPQLPEDGFYAMRGYRREMGYCFGPCCPAHGGPNADDPIFFQDGYTPEGRVMWCVVMPGFVNLQESPAGFDGHPARALANLKAAIAAAA